METSANILDMFNYDTRRVMENLEGFLEGEDITTYYDEFGAPLLDVIENETGTSFHFKLSSNYYVIRDGVCYAEPR